MTNLRLLDGPLMTNAERRKAMVEKMAADLVRYDAFRDEADAMRSLVFGCGYPASDVMVLVDAARTLAFQEIVAKEMGES